MAIDPSIVLGYRPPPVAIPNPLEQVGQVVSLRNLMQQGQMGALQLKQAQQQLQERENLAKLFAGIGGGQPSPVAPASPPAYDEPNLMGPAGGPAVVPPPAAAPPAQGPSQGGGFPTLGQILSVAPLSGMAIAKGYHETHKLDLENQQKQIDIGQKQWEGLGAAAQAILNAKDPEAAFVPGVMGVVGRGLLTDAEGRALIARGFNRDELQGFADRAQDVKTQAETKKTNLQALGEGYNNASKSISDVNDQASYTKWLPFQHPQVQALLGPTYSPQLKTAVQNWGVPQAEQPKTFREQALTNGMILAAARREGPEAFEKALAPLPPDQQQLFRPAKNELEIQQRSLDPEKFITTERAVRQEMTGQTNKLRDDFLHATEKFRDIRDAYSRVQAAKAGPAGGIQDIGLIYGYMKLVDPGSIVREGQAATVENASGVPDWVRNLYNKLMSGQRLPDETRAQVLKHVESIYANANKDQQAVEQDFTERAKRYGADPRDVIVPLQSTAGEPAAKPAADQSSASSAPLVPGYVQQGKDGQWHMYMGGDRFNQKNWQPVTKSGNDWIAR